MANRPSFTNHSVRQAARLGAQAQITNIDSSDRVRAVMHPYERVPKDLEQLESQIGELIQYGLASTWHIGSRLREIRDNKLYALKSYGDFKSYIQGEMSFEAAWAYQNIQLVELFSREIVERHGTRLIPAIPFIRKGGDAARQKVTTYVRAQGDLLRQSDLREQIGLWKGEIPSRGRPAKRRLKVFATQLGDDRLEIRVSDPQLMAQLRVELSKHFEVVDEDK